MPCKLLLDGKIATCTISVLATSCGLWKCLRRTKIGGYGRFQVLEETETRLADHLTHEKQRIQYQYDFGDSWYHIISVEKFIPREPHQLYPVCIKGKLNTPPEDIGGIWSFYHFLEIMANKKHPEHKEMKALVGGPYDPEHFDMEAINEALRLFWKEEFGK